VTACILWIAGGWQERKRRSLYPTWTPGTRQSMESEPLVLPMSAQTHINTSIPKTKMGQQYVSSKARATPDSELHPSNHHHAPYPTNHPPKATLSVKTQEQVDQSNYCFHFISFLASLKSSHTIIILPGVGRLTMITSSDMATTDPWLSS